MRLTCWRTVFTGLWLLAGVAAAHAQATAPNQFKGRTLEEARDRFKAPQLKGDLSALGHVLRPGVVLIPGVALETGFDTNPDEFFARSHTTPFGLVDGNLTLGFVNDRGATTIAGKGSILQYDDDTLSNTRWDGGVAIDNAYMLSPGLEATFGAYFLRDEIKVVPSDNTGAYNKFAYTTSWMETSFLTRFEQARYYGSVPFAETISAALFPFVENSQFSVRRYESVANFLIGRDRRIGFYAEFAGAHVDYFDQGTEIALDRDADEVWALAGLRVRIIDTLFADVGYRFNQRNFEDGRIHSHDSSYFDGKLVWNPLNTFQLVFNIDRMLVEPGSAFALVGDQITYAVDINYIPRDRWQLGIHTRHRITDQIGDTLKFVEDAVAASVSYQLSPTQSIYGIIEHKEVTEDTSEAEYDRTRLGIGTRIRF